MQIPRYLIPADAADRALPVGVLAPVTLLPTPLTGYLKGFKV